MEIYFCFIDAMASIHLLVLKHYVCSSVCVCTFCIGLYSFHGFQTLWILDCKLIFTIAWFWFLQHLFRWEGGKMLAKIAVMFSVKWDINRTMAFPLVCLRLLSLYLQSADPKVVWYACSFPVSVTLHKRPLWLILLSCHSLTQGWAYNVTFYFPLSWNLIFLIPVIEHTNNPRHKESMFVW